MIDLARIGLGIAFIPDYCIKHSSKDLTVVSTKEKLPPRSLIAATHPSLPLSASAEAFLSLFAKNRPLDLQPYDDRESFRHSIPRGKVCLYSLFVNAHLRGRSRPHHFCPNDAACRLDRLVHARIKVGKGKSVSPGRLKILFHDFPAHSRSGAAPHRQ